MKRRFIVSSLALVAAAAAFVGGAHRVALADAAAVDVEPGITGPHAVISAALDSLELRPDQRAAVDQVRADVRAQLAPVRAAHERVMEALAASVEAGSVDHATLDPLVAAAQTAAEGSGPVFESAATRLHTILDGAQRAQLIDTVRTKMIAEGGRHGLHALFGRGHADPLTAIGARIGLTDDQVTTIRAKFEAARDADPSLDVREGMHAHFRHVKAVADAFVSDGFDAHALGVGEHASALARHAPKMLAHLELALPVLTPEQRTQLAELLRSHTLNGA